MIDLTGKTKFLIQPMYASRGSWEALADSEELGFEVLELSPPPALTDDAHFARSKTWYQKKRACRIGAWRLH